MTKFDDFINDVQEPTQDLQELKGNYGCQVCERNVETAYFNEHTGEMFWYCSQKHKSVIEVQ